MDSTAVNVPVNSPLDLEALLKLIQEGQDAADKTKEQDIVLFFGKTGAGKTTSIYCLCGKRFQKSPRVAIRERNGQQISYQTGETELKLVDLEIPGFKIGNTMKSETKVINVVEEPYNKRLLCDSPGLEDTHGALVDIANVIGIKKALAHARSVRVVVVVNWKSISSDTRGGEWMNFLGSLSNLFEEGKFVEAFPHMVLLFSHPSDGATHKDMFLRICEFAEKLLNECDGVKGNATFTKFVLAVKHSAENKAFSQECSPHQLSVEVLCLPCEEDYPKLLSDIITSKSPIQSPSETFGFALAPNSKLEMRSCLQTIQISIPIHLKTKAYVPLDTLLTKLGLLKEHYPVSLLDTILEAAKEGITQAWNTIVADTQTRFEESLKDGATLELEQLRECLNDVFSFEKALKKKIPGTSTIEEFLSFLKRCCSELVPASPPSSTDLPTKAVLAQAHDSPSPFEGFSAKLLHGRIAKLEQLAARKLDLIPSAFVSQCDFDSIFQKFKTTLDEIMTFINKHIVQSIAQENFVEAAQSAGLITQAIKFDLKPYLKADPDLNTLLVQLRASTKEGVEGVFIYNKTQNDRQGTPNHSEMNIWKKKWRCLTDCAQSKELQDFIVIDIKEVYYEPLKIGLDSFMERIANKTISSKQLADANTLLDTVKRLNLLQEFDQRTKHQLYAARKKIIDQVEDLVSSKENSFKEDLKSFPSVVSRASLIHRLNKKMRQVQKYQEFEEWASSEGFCHYSYRVMVRKLKNAIEQTVYELRNIQRDSDDPKNIEMVAQRLYDLLQVGVRWELKMDTEGKVQEEKLTEADITTRRDYTVLEARKQELRDTQSNPEGINPWNLPVTKPPQDVARLVELGKWPLLGEYRGVLIIFLKNGFASEHCKKELQSLDSIVEAAGAQHVKSIESLLTKGMEQNSFDWIQIADVLGKLKQMVKEEFGKSHFGDALTQVNGRCRYFLRTLDTFLEKEQFTEFTAALPSLKDSGYVTAFLSNTKQSLSDSMGVEDHEVRRTKLLESFDSRKKEFLSPTNFGKLVFQENWQQVANVLSQTKAAQIDTYHMNVKNVKQHLESSVRKVRSTLPSLLKAGTFPSLDMAVSNLEQAQEYLAIHLAPDTSLATELCDIRKSIFVSVQKQTRLIHSALILRGFLRANQTLCSLLHNKQQFSFMCKGWFAVAPQDFTTPRSRLPNSNPSLDLSDLKQFTEMELKLNPEAGGFVLSIGDYISRFHDCFRALMEGIPDLLVNDSNPQDIKKILFGIKTGKDASESGATPDDDEGIHFISLWEDIETKLEAHFVQRLADLGKRELKVEGILKGLETLAERLNPLEGLLTRFQQLKESMENLKSDTEKRNSETVKKLNDAPNTKSRFQSIADAIINNDLRTADATNFKAKLVRENAENLQKLDACLKASSFQDLPVVMDSLRTMEKCPDAVRICQKETGWKDPFQPLQTAKATLTENIKELSSRCKTGFTAGSKDITQLMDTFWQFAPLAQYDVPFEKSFTDVANFILDYICGWDNDLGIKLDECKTEPKSTSASDIARIINEWKPREIAVEHLKHRFQTFDFCQLPEASRSDMETLKARIDSVPTWKSAATRTNKTTCEIFEIAKLSVEKEQWDMVARSVLLFNKFALAFPSEPELDQGYKCQVELINLIKTKRQTMKTKALGLWKSGSYQTFGEEVTSLKRFDMLFKNIDFYPLETEKLVESVTEVALNEVTRLKNEYKVLVKADEVVCKLFVLKQMANLIPALTKPVSVAIGEILRHIATQKGNNAVFQIGLALQSATGDDESRWAKEIIRDHSELKAIATRELNEILSSTRKGIKEVLAPPTVEPTEKNLRSLSVFWGTDLHNAGTPSWWSSALSVVTGVLNPVKRLYDAYTLYETVNTSLLKFYILDETRKIQDNIKALSQECIAVARNKQRDSSIGASSKDRIPVLIAYIFALWTLTSSGTFYRETSPRDMKVLRVPHIVQVVSIFRILAVDKHENVKQLEASHLQNHLIQIGTGEGKSVTLGVLSCILALHQLRPYCVCYSDYLSKRDREAFMELFVLLGIDNLVHYSTFEQLCNLLVNRHADVRELTTKFVCGDRSAIKGKGHNFEPTKSILLIDEVDVFFSETFFGSTYNPGVDVTSQNISDLIEYLWTIKDQPDQLRMSKITKLSQYQAVLNDLPQCAALLGNEVERMIHHLKHAAYMVPIYHPDKAKDKIGYPQHGNINFSMKVGYKTMWAYMHEFYITKNISEATKNKQRAISLCCGAFAYSEIPKKFAKILGVTGTLASMSEYEQSVVKDVYNIKKATFSPSVYGPNKCIFKEVADVHVQDKASWFQTIRQQIDKPIAEGRACLVFFVNETVLKDFTQSRYGSNFNKMNILTETTPDQEFYIKMASVSGQVTLLSRIYGRGIDFICQDQRVKKLGVHVIQTFLSESESEEVQVRGRTARQGQEGSFELLLCTDDLERDYGIQPEKVEQAFNANSLYPFLCSARNSFVETKAAERDKRFQKTQELHKVSDELLDILIQSGKGGIKDLTQREVGLAKLGQFQHTITGEATLTLLHTIFVIDVSGSMASQDARPEKDHLKTGQKQHDNRLGAVIEGTEIYISKRKAISPGDLVSVIGFNSGIPFYIAPQEVSNFDMKSLLQLVPSGGTDFDPPIAQVQSILSKYPPVHHTPFVFFLSDGGGECKIGPSLVRTMRAKWPNFRLDTCRFGSDLSGEPILSQLATAGAGTLLKSDASLRQLEQIMESMDLMFD